MVDEESKYKETALHIACSRGHFEVAQYLIQEKEASLLAVDSDENTVLHYATSSNNGKLLMWLLDREKVKAKIDVINKVSQILALTVLRNIIIPSLLEYKPRLLYIFFLVLEIWPQNETGL